MGDYRFVLFLEVCYVFSYCVCSQRREFKGQIGYKEGKGEIELVINVIDEEKKEDAEAVVLLSSCPRASEAGAEEALAMLSSYDRPVNLPHTSLSISSCERELQLQVFSEHSYSLSTLCSIDPGCSVDPSYSIDPSCIFDLSYSIDPSCIFDLSYSIDPSCILEISGSVEPSCSIETSGSIGSSCSIEPSVSVGSGCSIDLSLEEIYSYVTPEKMYSNFFNLGLLFRALFEFYRDKLLLHIYESVPVVVPQARSHTERVIKDAFSVILDSYIDNILSMRAVYRFLKCPGIHLSGYTEDRFLSESSIALLREELDLLMPHCVEGVTKTVLALSNSESIRKNKKTLLTDDLVSVISSSISGAFYKCVPIFLELITSREFLKKVFFKNIPGFDGKIFSPVSQNILSLNRRFFCKVSLLENRYLVSMVLGMVLGIGKEIPGIEELLDSYVKDLRDIVLDSVSKGLFFALGSSGDIVPLKAFIPVIEGVSDYLRRETSLRITSRKKVFRERLQIRGFWELDVSSGEDDGFYKSLDGVILNSKNYVGNGFSYYLMRVFAPICVSVARDVNKIFGSIIGSELSLLTCFRLEARVRYGMFDFIFSALSGMDTLSEVDKKLEKISPHVGMNVCELYDDIFSENIIERVKEAVISSFTVELFKDFFPKTISVLDKGKSIRMNLAEGMVDSIFESCAGIFCDRIKSIAIEGDFLNFYIEKTLFKEFGECCFAVSNVDILKVYPIKLDLICKIVNKIDRSYYMSSVFRRTPDFLVPTKGVNLELSSDKFETREFKEWLYGKIRLVITESALVLSSDGVVSELGESLETLLEAIVNCSMDECLLIARDVIYVDRSRVTVDRSREVVKQKRKQKSN